MLGSVWLPGTIVGVQGLLSFQIKLEDGHIVRRHIDHVRARVCDSTVLDQELSDDPLPISDNSASPESAAIPQPQSIITRRSNRICHPHPVPGHLFQYITSYIAFFIHASSFCKYYVIFPPSVFK